MLCRSTNVAGAGMRRSDHEQREVTRGCRGRSNPASSFCFSAAPAGRTNYFCVSVYVSIFLTHGNSRYAGNDRKNVSRKYGA